MTTLRPPVGHGEITALLDIGSAKIACALLAPDGRVIAVGLTASAGITSGLVTDPDMAHAVVAKAIVDAERATGLQASHAILAVTGGALALQSLAADVQLDPPIVTAAVVARLRHSLGQHAQRNDRAVIDAGKHSFRLDGRDHAGPPIDRFGRLLAVEQSVVTVDRQPLVRTVAAVEATGLPVARIVPAGIATALAVTTQQERAVSVGVIDIGAATTAVTIFARGRPTLVTSFAIGCSQLDAHSTLQDHQINYGRISETYGSSSIAHVETVDIHGRDGPLFPSPRSRVAMPGSTHDGRASSNDIGRLERLLRLVADRLDLPSAGLSATSPIVITGGGSRLTDLLAISAWQWARPVRLGWPSDQAMAAPEWSCLAGLAPAVREGFGVERPTSRAGARQVA